MQVLDVLTLSQALAPARRTPGVEPARVGATPGLPKLLREDIIWATDCSCPKRASAVARRRAVRASLEYMMIELFLI